MSVLMERPAVAPEEDRLLLPLEAGDRLDRATFHARYEAMPDVKAELIEGRVYMSSPVKLNHGKPHLRVAGWLDAYLAATPGVDGAAETTLLPGGDNEPQPDLCLYLPEELGGQFRTESGYGITAPELVVEIASSSASYDLHDKKELYERIGVREYVVVTVREPAIRWFTLQNGRYEESPTGDDGIYRSGVFPGLWLDLAALLRLDSAAIAATLQKGLASPEHQAFVEQLAARGAAAEQQLSEAGEALDVSD
jgi:Uma2 family endonuclease